MDKSEEVEALANIFALIRDDAYACSFQTVGQYRSALLRVIDRGVQRLFEEINNEEALRLADVTRLSRHHEWHLQVDAELRRQHGEIKSMQAERTNTERRLLAVEAHRDALMEANEAFSKRQQWWNEKMFTLEQQRDALLEALKELTPPMPPADAPCHVGLVPQEKCAHCGRIARARAAIKAVEGEKK